MRCSAAAPGRGAFELIPRELEPSAQSANALEDVRALRVEPIRIDCVDSAVSNRWNRFKTLPRLGRFASEAARDDHLGPGIEHLLAGNERGERPCSRKHVAPTAVAQRIADEVDAVHGKHGPVPDLEEHRDAALARVAQAQFLDLSFEFARARFGDVHAPGQRADGANDTGNIGEGTHFGDENPDTDALQTTDLQRRVAALPSEHEVRPQRDQALDIDAAVARDDRQALGLGRMAAEARDTGELRTGARCEGDLSQVWREGDDTLRRLPERNGDAAVIARSQRARVRRYCDNQHQRNGADHRESSESTAANAASTGSRVRHSLTLPPPQPSLPQGRHRCSPEATMRCSTRQGPHSSSPLGPKSATTRVPIAAAICMGAESTPTKSFARALSAASCFSVSFPEKSAIGALVRLRISSIKSSSRSSGAAVSAMRSPRRASASTSAPARSGGQHLNCQRDPGWK